LVFLRVITQGDPVGLFLGQSGADSNQDQEEDGNHSPDGEEHNHSVHNKPSRGSDSLSLRKSLILLLALQTAFHLGGGGTRRLNATGEVASRLPPSAASRLEQAS
jgi:hypothetical protein